LSSEPPRIAGPVAQPKKPRALPPPGTWDAHAHVFGPADKFPYTPGRGYTRPDAPVENFVALLDHNGCARGLVVQGNAHGYDNRVVLDAITRYPQRLRGVGLDVFEVFRKTMAELGWVMQVFCDWRLLQDTAPTLRTIARDMPVIVDHYGMVEAARGVNEPNFQALVKLVGEGAVHVKLSAPYRVSTQFPDYADAQALHAVLVAANPERLMWGTDWPHPSIAAEMMPDDGHLLDLFYAWTPDEAVRRRILVETPERLFGN
jgi:2-pyrone-4,6-dicarboxylate lactonase